MTHPLGLPHNFHRELAAHYKVRLASIVAKGLHRSIEYFFVRNALRNHESKFCSHRQSII